MSGRRCGRTHGRFGSAQIETNKFQSTLPEGVSDRMRQRIRGASLRRRVERPHHDTSQVVHLLEVFENQKRFDKANKNNNEQEENND